MQDEASILPLQSTLPYERAIEAASAERWPDVPADLPRLYKRVWDCPAHLLNFLAFEFSVDIWNENWPELKKRSVIASAVRDHRLKGTLAGTLRYLEIAEASLRQLVRPPQEFFAGADLTKDEWDAHLAKHPKVRVPLALAEGEWKAPEGTIADHAFADEDAVSVDDGRALRGRRAFMVHKGVTTPLQFTQLTVASQERAAVEHYRVTTPGEGVSFAHAGEFAADDSFADAFDIPPRWYSYTIDRTYNHETSRLSIDTVPVGFALRDTRHVRESDIGDGTAALFAGVDYANVEFVGADDGGDLLADVIRLFDPEVAAPITAGMSFADHSRVDMPAHTAEMMIDWRETMTLNSAILAGHSFAGEDPATAIETTRRDFLLDAVAASKRGSDRILVTFETSRERTLGDGIPLDRPTPLGGQVPNSL